MSALRRCIDVMRDIHHAKNRYSANTVFSETKIMQAGRTEDEELKQQRRMKVMTDVTKNQLKRQNGRWISEFLPMAKGRGITKNWEDTVQQWYNWLHEKKKKKKKGEKVV